MLTQTVFFGSCKVIGLCDMNVNSMVYL